MSSIPLSTPVHSKREAIRATGYFAIAVAVIWGFAEMVTAGGTTTTIFDQLAVDADAAIFGPLGQAIIGLCAAAGGIFALIKGNWLFAALGIAVAGLMVGARVVAGSSGFGAMITDSSAFLPVIGL